MAQSVEHVIGNDEVISSILITSSKKDLNSFRSFFVFYFKIFRQCSQPPQLSALPYFFIISIPNKMIIYHLSAVHYDALPRAKLICNGKKICPLGYLLGSCPSAQGCLLHVTVLGPKCFVTISIHIKQSQDIRIPPSSAIQSS